MKDFAKVFWNLLEIRITILLEYEPCDAAQTGYFQYLDEVRRKASGEPRRAVRTVPAPRRTQGVAGYGNL